MTTQRRVIYLVGLAMVAMLAGACAMTSDSRQHEHRQRRGGRSQ